MRRLLCSLSPATLLLAVMLVSALPRTLFHHCGEGATAWTVDAKAGAVHADTHCPICEAPVPLSEVVPTRPVDMVLVLLGEQPVRMDQAVPASYREAPRLRGPPVSS